MPFDTRSLLPPRVAAYNTPMTFSYWDTLGTGTAYQRALTARTCCFWFTVECGR